MAPFRPALLLVLAVACVPKGRYDAALAEQLTLSRRIEAQNQTLVQQADDLARVDADLAAARRELEQTRSRLVAAADEAGALKESVAIMEQALAELEQRKARVEEAMASYRDLVARFQAMIDAGTLKVKVVGGRMVVELATDILFAPGSATLSRDGRKAIVEVAKVLSEIRDREFQVAGHTDNDPIRTERFPSNWYLGAARAISVTELMLDNGLEGRQVSVSSYAEFKPADTNRTREGKAANRRIEIVVVPDLSMLPGFEEITALAEEESPPPQQPDPPTEPQPGDEAD